MLRSVLGSCARPALAQCPGLGALCSVQGAGSVRASCVLCLSVLSPRARFTRARRSVLGARSTPLVAAVFTSVLTYAHCRVGSSCHACGAQGGVLRRVLGSRAQFARALLRVTLTLMVDNPTFSFSFLFLGFSSCYFQDPLLNGVFPS